MINVLEFDYGQEFRYSWNVSSRTFYRLFYQLPQCMVLYRYSLAESFIWTKFGVNDPEKIKFEKLTGKHLILFHLDIYKEKTEKFRDLIECCNRTNTELWMPYNVPKKSIWSENQPHLDLIRDIWTESEHQLYDFTSQSLGQNLDYQFEETVIPKLNSILRNIRLRDLLD